MTVTELGPPRWRGQPGRIETWYATFTDTRTGDGYWVHAETLAREEGASDAHGWFAVFPADRPPVVERFGPEQVSGPAAAADWFDAAGCRVGPGVLTGKAGPMEWDLTYSDATSPLFTFPRWIWQAELLPGAQVVPYPAASFSGTVKLPSGQTRLEGARGALARIYGHGHAERWAWLHGDLSPSGDAIEIVSAVSRRPGLRLLPPASFVQLRIGGREWPHRPLAAASLLRGRIGLPSWSVRGTVGRQRLRVDVHIPDDASVVLDYRDPDGARARCTNSERADAEIVLERWSGRWQTDRAWTLKGTAHAEVGQR